MIYRNIPAASPCAAGCSDCCGPVPWSPAELARVTVPVSAEWPAVVIEGFDTPELATLAHAIASYAAARADAEAAAARLRRAAAAVGRAEGGPFSATQGALIF
jgi:hypothetical protein